MSEAIQEQEDDKLKGIICEMENVRIPEARNDSPFLVFPEELWELVLGKLEAPQDFLNVSHASPPLENTLPTSKATWLLELVLPYIICVAEMKENQILRFRCICKTWRRIIDKYLSTHYTLLPYCKHDFSATMTSRFAKPKEHNSFRGPTFKDVASMPIYHDGEIVGENPFVGRTICLEPSSRIDRHAYWSRALELVEKTGGHIWHLEAHCHHRDRTPWDLYLAIQRLLKYLPNLRSLSLLGSPMWFPGNAEHSKQTFVRHVTENGLPPLVNLVSLTISMHAMPGYFYDPFLPAYGSQVHKLQLSHWSPQYGSWLNNLVDLYVFVYTEKTRHCTGDVIKDLVAPEKLLKVVVTYPPRGTADVMAVYLEQLHKCRNLESFEIHGWSSGWTEKREIGKPRATLESLKYLRVLHHSKFTYEFLKQLPSLEHLYLVKDANSGKEIPLDTDLGVEIRKHVNFNVGPKETKLWDLLPSLSMLTVRARCATVEGDKTKCYTRKLVSTNKRII